MNLFILKDGKPFPVSDVLEWGRWLKTAKRGVKRTAVGKIVISTVFLGIDHSFGSGGPPILYETLVFGGKLDGETNKGSALV